MMAEAYAKFKEHIGAVCVTAGPGATNALPGLVEAYVECSNYCYFRSSRKKFSSDNYKNFQEL